MYYVACLHTIMFAIHPHSCIVMVDAIPCHVIVEERYNMSAQVVLSL